MPLGKDSAGYTAPLEDVGLTVDRYEDPPGWHERLVAAYSAVVSAEPALRPELGAPAMDALVLEMSLTLQLDPYRRRVLVAARRT